MLVRAIIHVIALSGIAGLGTFSANAEVPNATQQEVRWFVGKWAVGAADVPEFETISGSGDCKAAVDIAATGPTTIRRTVRLRNGALHSSEFTVKTFAGNFPWWSKDDIGGAVAKRTDGDSFILATTRNGKADWANGLKHTRCPR